MRATFLPLEVNGKVFHLYIFSRVKYDLFFGIFWEITHFSGQTCLVSITDAFNGKVAKCVSKNKRNKYAVRKVIIHVTVKRGTSWGTGDIIRDWYKRSTHPPPVASETSTHPRPVADDVFRQVQTRRTRPGATREASEGGTPHHRSSPRVLVQIELHLWGGGCGRD